MSPLQRIAMGLVVVVGNAAWTLPGDQPSWLHYDLLADPVGWLLVLSGTWALVRAQDSFDLLRWPAVLAALVSVPVWFPQVQHRLDGAGAWAASLPQIAFCLLLCRETSRLAGLQRPGDAYAAHRFGLLVWGFVAVGVLPVLTLGGGLDALAAPTQLVSLVVNVALVWFLFRVHRRRWLGGPGPLEIGPDGARGQSGRRTHEGRPPSS